MQVLILRLLLISAAEGTQASSAACLDFFMFKREDSANHFQLVSLNLQHNAVYPTQVLSDYLKGGRKQQGSLSFSDSEHICLC